MASLVGGVFEEYSELSDSERQQAVAQIGAGMAFERFSGPGAYLPGAKGNDLYQVDDPDTAVREAGNDGTDLVISAVSYQLDREVEHLILTGEQSLSARGNDANNVIAGNAGHNTMDGLDGDDALFGAPGNDTLRGGDGADTLFGGDGYDTLYGGNGDDVLKGEAGYDTLYGGDGHDTLYGGYWNDSLNGGDGNDLLLGESGSDTITGGDGNDCIDGGLGDDLLYGSDGDDFVFGEGGDDRLFGNDGQDCIDGGQGDDAIYGGDGHDTLIGGAGDDTLHGGDDADFFIFNDEDGVSRIRDFTQGQDRLGIGSALQAGQTAEEILDQAVQQGADVLLDLGGGSQLRLENFDLNQLDASDVVLL